MKTWVKKRCLPGLGAVWYSLKKKSVSTQKDEIINLGSWSAESINEILEAVRDMGPGDRIARISERFLGTPYQEATLTGNERTRERLVIDLSKVDCFTFLDYVEALRLSHTFFEFIENVKTVRYRSGVIGYANRNHFFTDWIRQNHPHVTDVTRGVGGTAAQTIRKRLNNMDDGTVFVPGIPFIERDINYLPASWLGSAISRLRTGDYLGIYSSLVGLDVSHTGIVIRDREQCRLRHASSKEGTRRVIDQDLSSYLVDRPGIIVLRPH